jgi:2-succinyl-6-hydroxy-2,4-cyclohexadiene-1-carboxylate synthase
VTLFPVHGFLQQPHDWREIPWPSGVAIEATDLWRDLEEISFGENAFKAWAKNFTKRVSAISGRKILIGYSLGGRLALHALKMAPELYDGAILVSCNPGLRNQTERDERIKQDLLWAERFRNTPWEKLLREWDAQAVFQTTSQAGLAKRPRLESSFSRIGLVRALDQWSLGRQEDLRQVPAGTRTLVISGQQDTKFTQISTEWAQQTGVQHRIVENVGHRVPWEQPRAFSAVVADFIRERNA